MENQQADRELVSRVLHGDRGAFALVLKNTEALVATIIYKMVPVPADRKDLAQEVYLKVYKGLGAFRFQAKLSTWIGQVTYHTCLRYLQKKKLVLLTDEETDRLAATAGPGSGADEAAGRKELALILDRALQQLPPLQQLLVTLYHRQELTYGEIMAITGLPEGSIKSYLYRARQKIKEILSENYQPGDL